MDNKEQREQEILQLQAKHEFWRRGKLFYKCHAVQKEMYNLFYVAEPRSTLVWLLARQSGKSYLLGILALEHVIKIKRGIVKIMTDTKTHLESIFEPIFNELLLDCPEELKPRYNKVKFTYEFPNGSEIQLAGSDNKHYQKLRGQKSILVLVDEAGFCNDLEDAIDSVLFPTTTHTKGKIILASTPPEEEDHPFLKYIEVAEIEGRLVKKTIFDNPLLTIEDVQNIAKKMGGIESRRFRREYCCELIRNDEITVFPEFDESLQKLIIKEWPKPPFMDTYEAMDLGWKDFTGLLFGYYDFRANKVIIEDEIAVRGKDFKLPVFVEDIRKKEAQLWTNVLTNELIKPKQRVSDINYLVTQEIARESNGEFTFTPTKKDDKASAINNTRVMIANGQVIIHPRCVTLIRHIKNCRWAKTKSKSDFARSPDDGHYDLVMALVYLIRCIDYNRNPYPIGYNLNKNNLFVNNPDRYYNANNQKQIDIFKKIFKRG